MKFIDSLFKFINKDKHSITIEKIYALFCLTQIDKKTNHCKRDFATLVKRWRVSLNENYFSFFKVFKTKNGYSWKFYFTPFNEKIHKEDA